MKDDESNDLPNNWHPRDIHNDLANALGMTPVSFAVLWLVMAGAIIAILALRAAMPA